MSKAVTESLYSWIAADQSATSFYTAVGGRVYHIEAPENTELPVCVFGIDDPASLDGSFGGAEHDTFRVRFIIWVLTQGTTPDITPDTTAYNIDQKLRTRLHNQNLTATGYDRLQVLQEIQGQATKDEDSVRIESVYRVRGTRS